MYTPIHPQDFAILFRRLKTRGAAHQFRTLLHDNAGRVCHTWSQTSSSDSHWWDLPEVQQRQNALITGNSRISVPQYVARKYLRGCSRLKALSIGCGTGDRELLWARTGKFSRIDACDISRARIEEARARCQRAGLQKTVHFFVSDVFALNPLAKYNAVLAEGILHHLTPLSKALKILHELIIDGGFLFANEYVGPRRFQWTAQQIAAINGVLAILPENYKTRRIDGSIKSRVYRPGWLSMWISDPSEAAESDRIVPLLKKEFSVLEIKEYGGTILQLLFKDIAHHFVARVPLTQQLIRLCFEVEDLCLRAGHLESDFAFIACRKKGQTGGT